MFSDIGQFIDNMWQFDRICFEPNNGIKIQMRVPNTSADSFNRLKKMYDNLKEEYNKMLRERFFE